MKKICLLLLINMIVILTYSSNLIKIINLRDSCNLIKLTSLSSELFNVVNSYLKFNINAGYQYNERIIIYMDYKIIDDSTNLYIITESKFLNEILENIPSYYYLGDKYFLFIYTGNEIVDTYDYNCIKSLLFEVQKYSKDTLKVLSKEKLIFENKSSMKCLFYDPPIIKIKVINKKIVYMDFVKTYPARLYKRNLKGKIIIY
ncbi:hypothetical protein KAZ01_02760 [Candidatus Gracilibacteria bacterium]|nr:hypothetical protein [Candidatus Gracilibacteria bacterium]